MKKKYKIVLLAACIVLFLQLGNWIKMSLEIDHCLDSGGKWNFEDEQCEYGKFRKEIDKCMNRGGRWDFNAEKCIMDSEPKNK